MTITLLDFESRSRAKLKSVGGRNYWTDPSTEAVCCVLYEVESGRWSRWLPGEAPPRLDVAVAHNWTGFDRFAAAACGFTWRAGLDSAQYARRAGLPGALDALGKRWYGVEKDKAGNRLTLSLSQPSRAAATKGDMPPIAPVLDRVVAYCASDVEIMANAWPRLAPWADVDAGVPEVDRVINDRGLALDVELLEAVRDLLERYQDRVVADVADELWATPAEVRRDARSPVRFAALTGLPNAQKETIQAEVERCALAGETVHPLTRARAALASIIAGKVTAGLGRVSPDGRLRDTLLYYGGHTGRWSGKGMQLQNLTRTPEFDGDAERLIRRLVRAAKRRHVPRSLLAEAFPKLADPWPVLFAVLVRAAIHAPAGKRLAVLDYSGIEARANAWQAGDRKALEVFREYDAGTGADPYCVMAVKVFMHPVNKKDQPTERQIGKNCELGAGYGMGGNKFNDYCLDNGTDLAAHGVDSYDVIAAWRELHRPIVQSWYSLERAWVGACEGRDVRVGPFTFTSVGDDVAAILPSGRPVVYPEARARRVKRTLDSGRTIDAWDMTFLGHRHREHVYGGKLCENLVQALCRDLLADALERAEADGLDPVLHVHDEVVLESTSDAIDALREIMTTPPDWAKGLPVSTSGFCERRYRK